MAKAEVPRLRLEYRKASELADNPRNWRKHPASQTRGLKAVLAEVGWAGAVLFNERTGRLIDGHLRKAVSGDEEVPVLVGSWSEEQEKIILKTYDPIGAMAETDKDALKALLAEGNGSEEINRLLASVAKENHIILDSETRDAEPQIDKAEELNRKWKVKMGDLWQIGEHRLLCGDATKAKYGDKAIATITDPPYGITKNDWDRVPTQADLDIWLGSVTGAVVAFGASRPDLVAAMLALQPQAERIYIWWNTYTPHQSEGAFWQWQAIYVWRRECLRDVGKDVLAMTANTGGGKQYHVTQKPVPLMMQLVGAATHCGEVVFDPFLGSGTTMVACENLGCKCRAIEISPAYCAVTLERMTTAFPGIEVKKIG